MDFRCRSGIYIGVHLGTQSTWFGYSMVAQLADIGGVDPIWLRLDSIYGSK
jgi:hypothetical protein